MSDNPTDSGPDESGSDEPGPDQPVSSIGAIDSIEIQQEMEQSFLDYAMSVETTDTSSSVVYSYDGDLVWSGDVSGACVISMKASVSATAGVGASVSYEGSICGYDAAATLNVQI